MIAIANAQSALRSRFQSAWKSDPDLAGLDTMFENALSFMHAPSAKKAELEKPGRLSASGVSEELRKELSKGIVPELRRTYRILDDRQRAIKQERALLAKPKMEASEAPMRQEIRAYLRALEQGERMQALTNNPDPIILAAALEGPAALSGLNEQTRGHVVKAYLETNHAATLARLDDREEAYAVVRAAVDIAVMEMRANVGLEHHAFDTWFSGTDSRQAA